MDFLHFAIFLFVVCVTILVAVSVFTAPPPKEKLAGLTFATVGLKPEERYPGQRFRNAILSVLLIACVVALWLYFS